MCVCVSVYVCVCLYVIDICAYLNLLMDCHRLTSIQYNY